MGVKSPLQRSKAALEEAGYLVWITETWNAFARIRQDLWGIADLICLRGEEVLAVQVTSRNNVSARCKKIADAPTIGPIRAAGIRVEVHGWGKLADGKYHCRIVDVS